MCNPCSYIKEKVSLLIHDVFYQDKWDFDRVTKVIYVALIALALLTSISSLVLYGLFSGGVIAGASIPLIYNKIAAISGLFSSFALYTVGMNLIHHGFQQQEALKA